MMYLLHFSVSSKYDQINFFLSRCWIPSMYSKVAEFKKHFDVVKTCCICDSKYSLSHSGCVRAFTRGSEEMAAVPQIDHFKTPSRDWLLLSVSVSSSVKWEESAFWPSSLRLWWWCRRAPNLTDYQITVCFGSRSSNCWAALLSVCLAEVPPHPPHLNSDAPSAVKPFLAELGLPYPGLPTFFV